MKIKAFKTILSILLAAAVLSGCSGRVKPDEQSGSPENNESAQNDKSQETKKNSGSEETQVKEQKPSTDLSDELYSYQIQIDDDVYTFPMSYQEFEDKGWKFDGDTPDVLAAAEYLSGQIWKKDKLECYTYISNFEKTEQAVSECDIAGIELNGIKLKKSDATFILPKNIQYEVSAKEDVIAAYGSPSRETDSLLTYAEKNYSEVRITLNLKTNLVDGVVIQKLVKN